MIYFHKAVYSKLIIPAQKQAIVYISIYILFFLEHYKLSRDENTYSDFSKMQQLHAFLSTFVFGV